MTEILLMVLGASENQVPIIKKAHELGCHVISVDNIPGNIGHKVSDTSVNCSTTDREGVLKAAKRYHINGIVTMASDVAIPTVAYVAQSLCLPGCSELTATTLSNKAKFRAFQNAKKLRSPSYIAAYSMEEVDRVKHRVTLPVIFKPVDSSGSRGVIQVDSDEGGVWRNAFDYAKSFSRSGMVCIEEYVEGVDISGDGFLYEGDLWAVITRKHKKGFIPTGHSLPTDLSQKQQQLVLDAVKLSSDLCGYTNGPIDFDVRVSDSCAVVLEMSPRLGGNSIPAIIKRGTGVDLVQDTILAALGEKLSKPADVYVKNPCGSLIFGCEVSGRLVELADQKQIRERVPEVYKYRTFLSVGDDVEPFTHSAHAIGYALFDCPTTLSYEYLEKKLRAAIHMQVES